MTIVDNFWSNHMVGGGSLCTTKEELLTRLERRRSLYPEADLLLGLCSDKTEKTVLDFGSGPGYDLCNLSIFCNPKLLVGIDISPLALSYAEKHLNLLDVSNYVLYKIEDSLASGFPIFDFKFDYIHSGGVLHHTSYPEKILLYLKSLMHKDSVLGIMVYSTDSIFNHLYAKYECDSSIDKIVDTGTCPVVKTYSPNEFISLCNNLGFDIEFLGGYTDPRERIGLIERIPEALKSSVLSKESKTFLEKVEVQDRLPYYNNKLCGLGGVYRLKLI